MLKYFQNKNLNKNFALLMMGRMISDVGTGVQMVILPLYIIDAGGSAATVGIFSFLSLVPALLVFPLAGVLGDRHNRKHLMIISDFVSGLMILSLAFCSYTGKLSMPFMLIAIAVVSLAYGFFDPATKGMLPSLVSQDELQKANSTVASVRILSSLLSPVLGASLYAWFGVTSLFFVNGVSFFLSGMCSFLIKYNHTGKPSEQSVLTDLSEGIKFIASNKAIRTLCLYFLLLNTIIQPLFAVVLPLFFKTRLSYSDAQYGYLQMFMIFGALIGTVLIRLKFSKENELTKSLALGSITLMGAVFTFSVILFPVVVAFLGKSSLSYFTILSAALCIISIGFVSINIPVQTFIQKETPNDFMSRVFSIVGLIMKGGMPFGALIYGSVLGVFPVQEVCLITSILTIFLSIIF